MKRYAFALILAFLVSLAASWIMENPGQVIMNWRGWRLETSFATLASLVFATIFLVILLQMSLRWAWREMPLIGSNRHLKRQRRGLEAMNRAIVALAAGDHGSAARLIEKAKALLPPQPMVHVLAAQVARQSGDDKKQKEELKALLTDPKARFIGLKALARSALRQKKYPQALTFIDEALDLEPRSVWAQLALFEANVGLHNWQAAEQAMARARRAGRHSGENRAGENWERQQAAFNYCRAKDLDLSGARDEALKYAVKSLKCDPSFTPASLLVSRLELARGARAKARKTLEAAWEKSPDPELADALADLEPSESVQDRYRRFRQLAKKAPNQEESWYQLARWALAADRLDEARQNINAMLAKAPSPRVLRLQAELLLREGGDDKEGEAARLREKADSLPPVKRWQCSVCEARQDSWKEWCDGCGSFNSFSLGSHVPGPQIRPRVRDDDAIALLPELAEFDERLFERQADPESGSG